MICRSWPRHCLFCVLCYPDWIAISFFFKQMSPKSGRTGTNSVLVACCLQLTFGMHMNWLNTGHMVWKRRPFSLPTVSSMRLPPLSRFLSFRIYCMQWSGASSTYPSQSVHWNADQMMSLVALQRSSSISLLSIKWIWWRRFSFTQSRFCEHAFLRIINVSESGIRNELEIC